jgi:citrate lyase beta subunit
MNEAQALPLLSIHAPPVTSRLVRQVLPYAGTVVLDLEDSCWDPIRPERSAALREQSRGHLLDLSRQGEALFAAGRIGFRINRFESPEFEKDLELLGRIPQRANLAAIVATKVETPDTLSDIVDALHRHGIAPREIVPIVETVRGIENLPQIVAAAPRLGVHAIVYGHYDFSLDAGHWPFLEFDDLRFWEWVQPIVRTIEAAGLTYIHPPFFRIYDAVGFDAVLGRLADMCSRPFGVLVLGPRQAAACPGFVRHSAPPLPAPHLPTEAERAELAMSICRAFENYENENKGFAVDPISGYFISPHLYAAARAYLENS